MADLGCPLLDAWFRRLAYTRGEAMSQPKILPPKPTRHLARLTLVAFLFTFIASRTLVILIMARRVPDLFLHIGGTHMHHLNYGIFLLSAVAGVLLFARLNNRQRSVCAMAYGFAMALTFDEFGMWLHLGGSYWQRASFDAVIVLLGVFGILAFLPRWQRLRAHHYVIGGALLASVALFYLLLFKSLSHASDKLMPRLMEMEQKGPK
jgi:glucose dehydrogenase